MDLEELTNKQLRQKCLEYGLPNVPITDTNRKLLLRRLNAAMNGTTPNKKSSSTKTNTPTNRRKTVHATITTTVSSGDEDDFVIRTQRSENAETRRRQTVAPAAKVTAPIAKASPTKPKPSAPKQTYERIVPIGFDGVANSTRISEAIGKTANNDHQRRSVSLSKTGVLTTSYSTETTKLPLRTTTYEQDVEEDDYDEPEDDLDDIEMENVEKAEATKTYTHPLYSGYNQATSYNATNYGSPTFAMPASPQLQAPKNTLYPDLHATGLQADYYNSFDGVRASHSSSARQSNLGFTRNAPTSYIPPSSSPQPLSSVGVNRHTIAGGSGSSYGSGGILGTAPMYQSNLTSNTKRYTTGSVTKRYTARAVDNDELAASSSDDQYETPYLSKFSRNLENIQPQPIYKRTNTATSYTSLGPKRRRATYEHDNGTNFSQLWTTLEQKYHLKTAFYSVLFFVIAAFIYVFFLQ